MSKLIPLTRGQNAVVNDENYEFLNQWKWNCTADGYAAREEYLGSYKRKTIYMHALIMDKQKGQQIDHINRNRLDNRRENLRKCTWLQNSKNRKRQYYAKSIYKGLTYRAKVGQWEARIDNNRTHYHIGYFKNERHAALAYDLWAKDLHGKFAGLNFKSII